MHAPCAVPLREFVLTTAFDRENGSELILVAVLLVGFCHAVAQRSVGTDVFTLVHEYIRLNTALEPLVRWSPVVLPVLPE